MNLATLLLNGSGHLLSVNLEGKVTFVWGFRIFEDLQMLWKWNLEMGPAP